MTLERFVYANLVLAPLVVAAGYYFWESIPVLVLPIGVAYLTFVFLISFGWLLSNASLAIRSS
ncbi:hypothetical protein [Halobiforma nitratireducens]|uniref:Uncharacterized protein n=1 Tax=Halobiforma nitratireducens JCM 10879 TaxID=1227454 RepID=M0MF73_9EURY|nr:hypothetical protein [Halobiforma nitratireducens]EMA43050.1 hypothetical protein C446_03384 [Halobiforma nitratireducens JCM 10879]